MPIIFQLLEFIDTKAIPTNPGALSLNLGMYVDAETFLTSDDLKIKDAYNRINGLYGAKVTEIGDVSLNEGTHYQEHLRDCSLFLK